VLFFDYIYRVGAAWVEMKEDKGKTPLRIILHNFLNHIEKLEAHRSSEDSYEKEFQVGCQLAPFFCIFPLKFTP